MALLSRKKKAAEPAPSFEEKEGGKNRPTPKRKDAIAARPVTPYMKGSKAKGARGARTADRAARSDTYAQRRQAAERGELPRDAGPERALVRDVVDSRRNMLGLMMFLALGLFVESLVGNALPSAVSVVITSGLFAFFLVAMLDAAVLMRLIRKHVRAKFPDYRKPYRFYAFQRAISPRRLRIPKPRRHAGDPL
ncbi:MAG TPA: DUF3043 domain-containing protein [Mycobacteriales bacterium]|nr:DUF3043 domain-containing protein [Mycobacteriales bacterium]